MRRDFILFRYAVNLLIFAGALILAFMSPGGLAFQLLQPGEAPGPRVTRPALPPHHHRVLEALPGRLPRPRNI